MPRSAEALAQVRRRTAREGMRDGARIRQEIAALPRHGADPEVRAGFGSRAAAGA